MIVEIEDVDWIQCLECESWMEREMKSDESIDEHDKPFDPRKHLPINLSMNPFYK